MFDLSADNPQKLWPERIVPFIIDEDDFPLGTKRRQQVEAALQYWSTQTSFKFVSKRSWHEDYLVITEHNSNCFSHVGRQGGAQYIRCDLDTGRFDMASLMHELGHALGFDHEDYPCQNLDKFLGNIISHSGKQNITLDKFVNW